MRARPRIRLDLFLPWTLGCALGLWLSWAPALSVQPFGDLRPSPGRFVGLDYQPPSLQIPRRQALEIQKEKSRLDRFRYEDRRPELLRAKSIYSLAKNQPDPSADWLEEAVAMTEGLEQALLRSDLAAVLLARSWPEWHGRPGYFPRGDDLFRAIDLSAQALEIIPDLREAQFNLALSLEAIGLREIPKEEWRRYLALDSNSPWAKEAREHLRRLAVPVSIPARSNALQPEGPLDDSDPVLRTYRAGRAALRDQRYDEARAAFRKSRTLWRTSNPRMAEWATYRIGVCDYFDPKIVPHDGPHGDGPHLHNEVGPAGGTMFHLCGVPGLKENLSSILDSKDPELAARASYLLGIVGSGWLPSLDGNRVLGVGLLRANETGDPDLVARLETAFAVQLQEDRHRAGLHHLAALHSSLRALSSQTRLAALTNASEWAGNSELWHAATVLGQESVLWTSRHRNDLHPVSVLQADLLVSWGANIEKRLDLARAAIVRASLKALRISDPGLRVALFDRIFTQEWDIHLAEQGALFSRLPKLQVRPAVFSRIDRERLMPELQPLYSEFKFCPRCNLWPLVRDMHRAIDRLDEKTVEQLEVMTG